MKNGVFWDMTPRESSKIRHFRGTYRLNFQGEKITLAVERRCSVLQLLPTANVFLLRWFPST
jgi:hypothetical protein